jgi:hypothetical protein
MMLIKKNNMDQKYWKYCDKGSNYYIGTISYYVTIFSNVCFDRCQYVEWFMRYIGHVPKLLYEYISSFWLCIDYINITQTNSPNITQTNSLRKNQCGPGNLCPICLVSDCKKCWTSFVWLIFVSIYS